MFRYDFDFDGFIEQEDVRIVLSHVPIERSVEGNMAAEGTFTMEGGGGQVYLDRLKTQEEIQDFLN